MSVLRLVWFFGFCLVGILWLIDAVDARQHRNAWFWEAFAAGGFFAFATIPYLQ